MCSGRYAGGRVAPERVPQKIGPRSQRKRFGKLDGGRLHTPRISAERCGMIGLLRPFARTAEEAQLAEEIEEFEARTQSSLFAI